jgi:hypothetical protein
MFPPGVLLTDLAPLGEEDISPVIHDINDRRDSHDLHHDRWWSEGVRYVYDAAAERAKQWTGDVDLSIEQ